MTRTCDAYNGKTVCASPAFGLVYWPGRTLAMCQEHARRAVMVADAVGFIVEVVELSDPRFASEGGPSTSVDS